MSPEWIYRFPKISGRLKPGAALKDYVVYKIGGPADLLVEPADAADIQKTLEFCDQNKIPLQALGNGSNLLIRDGGIRGICLYLGSKLEAKFDMLDENDECVRIRVPAHWAKAKLLDLALERQWTGLEFSAGIPGTIGGAVFMNAGTKWGSYGEVIEKVRFFSPARGFFERSHEEMKFKYRGHGEGLMVPGTVIVSADFRLMKGKPVKEIRSLVDEILTYRGSKQPLELPNCGSVFKNPENSERGAGRLIEACGLKGLRIGNAQVSLKHANFILNLGGALASDVEQLIQRIREKVKLDHNIQLETEVIILGEATA